MNPKKGDITISGKIKRCPSNFQCYINAYPGGPSSVNYVLCNHGSDHGMFRLYDKQYETLYGRHKSRAAELMQGDGYWYRAEIELHNGYTLWANESFYNLLNCDFNLYSIIGKSFDDWFAVRVRDFDVGTFYSSSMSWDSFVGELIDCIHFV